MVYERRKLYKIATASKAKEVLLFIKKHDMTRYTNLKEVAGVGTLNERLFELVTYGLIDTNKKKKKKKRYKITEKGKKVLDLLQEIEDLVQKEGILKFLSLKYSIELLDFIYAHGETQHQDMVGPFQVHTLHFRLNEFYDYGLVDYTIKKLEKRRPWYEVSPLGEKVLKIVDEIVEIVK